jgi:hypothetical protein
MKRTQVQLDEVTYERLRRRAFEQGVSMAALIREALQERLETRPSRHERLEDFLFIASGRSGEGGPEPISERHDEALAEDFRR